MERPSWVGRWDTLEFPDLDKPLCSLRIQPEVFHTDHSGLKLSQPSPGCVITITDNSGNAASMRIDGETFCAEVADFIKRCGKHEE